MLGGRGGGGSVTIGQIQYVIMAHSGGMGVLCLQSTVVLGVPAKPGGEPCGDTTGESVCLGCFKRADVY